MRNFIATRSRGHLWVFVTVLVISLGFALFIPKRASANTYTNPFWGSTAPVGDHPWDSVWGGQLVPIGIGTAPCDGSSDVSMGGGDGSSGFGVNSITGELIGTLSLWSNSGTSDGASTNSTNPANSANGNSGAVNFRGMLSGSTQLGCGGALMSLITTAETLPDGSVRIRWARGRILTFAPDGSGGFFSPAGNYDTLSGAGTAGDPYVLTDRHGNALAFDVRGMPSTYVDRNDNTTIYSADVNYRLETVTTDRDQTITLTHNPSGHIATINDPDGNIWTFDYDGTGHLTRITSSGTADQPHGVFYDIGYDAFGRVIDIEDEEEEEDPGGGGGGGGGGPPDTNPKHYQIAYVGATQQVASVTVDGCTTSFGYSPGVTTVTDPNGNISRYYYTGNTVTATDMLVGGLPKYVTTFNYTGVALTSVVYPRGNRIDFSWDGFGNLLERRHKETSIAGNSPSDLVHIWTYDANSFEISYTDPMGNQWTYTRDAAGNLTQTTNPTVTSPATQVSSRSYVYNSRGQITQVTDEEGNVTSFTYFETGTADKFLLKKVEIDPLGLDLERSLTYDSRGNIATVTDKRGNIYSFTWDALRRLTERQAPSPLSYRIKYLYDPRGRVVLRDLENVDKDGNQDIANPWIRTSYERDARYNVTKITEEIDASMTRETALDYDCNDNVIRVTKPEGNKETWEYDERDRVTKRVDGETDPKAVSDTFEYDENDNLTKVINGRSHTTTITYDLFDRRAKVTNALNHYTDWSYDKNGNLTKTQRKDSADVELQRVDHFFDERNRRWKQSALFKEGVTTHADAVTTWERLKTGQVSTHTSPSSAVTTYTYDVSLRLTEVLDAAGNEWRYTMDGNGNVTALDFEEVDGASSVIHGYEAVFDAMNRRTQWAEIDRTNSSNKLTTKYHWDSRTNLVFKENAEGNPTRWTFDALDRLIKREQALTVGATIDDFTAAQVTEWGFDKNNRLTSHKDDSGNMSSYDHDALDRLTKLTYPDLKFIAYEYDKTHNTTKVTDPAGNVVDDVFDALNRSTSRTVTKATGFLGTSSETRTYDALDRVLTNEDNDYKLAYEYAEIGVTSHVRKETQQYVGQPAQALSFTKTYDSRGNIVGETYPSGASLTLTLAYNGISQLTSITDGTNTIASYTHVGLRRKKTDFQNGTTQTNSFTGFRNELATIHHETSTPTTILQLDYGYNKVHDRTHERFGGSGASGDAFEYDKLRRLTKVWQGSSNPSSPSGNTYVQTIDYNYDDDGNRSSVVTTPSGGSAATASYSTNNLNQYTSVGGTIQTHDANGNLTKNGTYKFEYNYKNLIVKVRNQSTNALIATYKYDPLGRRVEKDVGGTIERYFLCTREADSDLGNLANMMCTYDGSGNWQQSFVHHGEVDDLAMLEQADVLDYDTDGNTTERTRSFYHLNALGSVMEITDQNEALVASYRYDPYGKVTITRNSVIQTSDPLGQNWGFNGRFHDAENGLLYYRARYYDDDTGRFLQRDPLGYSEGPSLYEYVRSNPVNLVDPSGLKPPRVVVVPYTPSKKTDPKEASKENAKNAAAAIKKHNEDIDKGEKEGDKVNDPAGAAAGLEEPLDTDGDDKPDAPSAGYTHLDKWTTYRKGKIVDGVCKGLWFLHKAWQYVILVPEGSPASLEKHEKEHVEKSEKALADENKKNEKEKKDGTPKKDVPDKKAEAVESAKDAVKAANEKFDTDTGHGRRPAPKPSPTK